MAVSKHSISFLHKWEQVCLASRTIILDAMLAIPEVVDAVAGKRTTA